MEYRCRYTLCPYGGHINSSQKDYVRDEKGKYFHKDCYELQTQRNELVAYLCFILKLKSPGPLINGQISNFLKQGMTYKGIENALRFYFDVQGHTDKRDLWNKSIGIVPYVYQDAQNYYNELEKKKAKLKREVEVNKEVVVVARMAPKEIKKPKYNLDSME